MKRKKRIKLLERERRLLMYPPTETTWVCESHFREDGTTYSMVNSGKEETCGLCQKPKPKKPKLLWPEYVKLCEKVGIEPGMIWKQKEDGTPIMREKAGSWQKAPEL